MSIGAGIMVIVILAGWVAVSHLLLTKLGMTKREIHTNGCCSVTTSPGGEPTRKGCCR
ncbi:MAG: hypothetical protein AB7E47_08260 [Desulfovibrionaceae bacterium]